MHLQPATSNQQPVTCNQQPATKLMSSEIKISLIVPAYNRTDNTRIFIRNIVENHQGQLHEIIVSDDGSSENQEQALKEYAPELKIPCKLVMQEDKGFRLARARNNGVRYSTGDYICFLDQDLLPSPGYFHEIRRFARHDRFLLTRTLYTTPEQKERIVSEPAEDCLREIRRLHNGYIWRTVIKDYFYYLGKKIGMGKTRPKLKGGAFSLFKEAFVTVNGFDETFIGWGREDDDLGRRLYLSGICGFNISHRAYTCHLWHPETPSKSVSPNFARARNKIYNADSLRPQFGLLQDSGEKVEVIRIN